MTEEIKYLLVVLALAIIGYAIWRTGLLQALARKPTARCVDGTFSYSVSRCGTCSHHYGVEEWIPA